MEKFIRRISGTKYKYVSKFENLKTKEITYVVWLKKGVCKHHSHHKTERKAALAVDTALILCGMKPLNILKPII